MEERGGGGGGGGEEEREGEGIRGRGEEEEKEVLLVSVFDSLRNIRCNSNDKWKRRRRRNT